MSHPERADDSSSDPKSPLFPKMYVNHRDQVGGIGGGGRKPPPRTKMVVYEHQPAAAGSVHTSTSKRLNTATTALLPATMPPPPTLLHHPKYGGISPSGSPVCYVSGPVPPASAAVRPPFYAHNTATVNTSMLPTLPLLPFSKPHDGQPASISQEKKHPPQVSSGRSVEKRHPELEIFHQSHFRNDIKGSRGFVADDSVESYTLRYATRADPLMISSSTTNCQLKQSNHSSIAFVSSSSTKLAHNSREEVSVSELIPCLPTEINVDDIRGVVGVATSKNTPPKHYEYRGDPELQNVSNRKGSHPEITHAEPSCAVISPEDVTAIIGKEAFLRIRGEMIKHQKQFVDQVFELHRLITVQRLIARSRRQLFVDKYKLERRSSSRGTMNPKEAQKGHRVERQYDDTFRLKTSSGSVTDMFDPPPQRKDTFNVPPITTRTNQETYTGNPKPVNASGINSPWISPLAGAANHWLVPIMSPSEGLIYKPYPIPAAPRPAGIRPKPAQTHPAPGQQSGIRPFPDYPFNLSPYVTPSISSRSAFEHVGKSESYQHPMAALPGSSFKSSWKISTLGSGTVSCQVDVNNQAKYGGDRTASSSPPERTQGNILPLFPEEPSAIAMLNKPQHTSEQQQRKVTKVVPDPPASATESTARIIRSIWVERN